LRIVICGIGQWFRGEDAIGLAVVEEWLKVRPPSPAWEAKLVTAPVSELPDAICFSDAAILIDAMHNGHPPGEILLLEDIALLSPAEELPSTHGFGLMETIRLIRKLPGQQTKPIFFVGISACKFGIGDPVSAQLLGRMADFIQCIDQALIMIQTLKS
jgi:hydrogenase maturation protease